MQNKVYLIGAGPGDAELLTVKAQRILSMADVVLYDRLVSDDILAMIPAGARRIDVGKKPGAHRMTQEEITQEIVKQGQRYKTVVRLKGGDVFVFGRGGEEILGLIEAGIAYEVVPGITSAIAAPAYSGIPITHRGIATSFHVFTGHFQSGEIADQMDFGAMARLQGTLVFLMSVGHLTDIVKGLINAGKSKDTPAAIIENGTRAYQRHFTATLGTIEQTAKDNSVVPPSIILVGDVAKFSDAFYIPKDRPLLGKKVIVTRSRAQTSVLKTDLQKLGAKVLECPSITCQTSQLDDADIAKLKAIDAYQWIIFTSANAVTSFFEQLSTHGIDHRKLGAVKFCVIGKKTKETLLSFGYRADIMPKTFHAFELTQTLLNALTQGDKILRVSGGKADNSLHKALREKGYDCDEIRVYAIKSGSYYIGSDDITSADIITFTSGSTIDFFGDYLKGAGLEPLVDTPCVVIGPTTEAKAKSAGYKNIFKSDTHTIAGVVNKVVEKFS